MDGIVIADVAGKVLNTFKIYNCGSYFGTAKDRFYFTDEENKTVHCISMAGEEIWVRKEKSLVSPRGITVDDHQNVFIVDCDSNLLIVIQHDKSSSRTLLSKTDGLVHCTTTKTAKYYFCSMLMGVPCTILASFYNII